MVLMALVTTFMTGPLLALNKPKINADHTDLNSDLCNPR
jgi:hypothetical protein